MRADALSPGCAGDVEIRRATAGEVPALLAIFNASRRAAGCFTGGDADLLTFERQIDGEALHVALLDGEPAGFAAVYEPERFVHHLYVAPWCQKRGVGRRLLDECARLYGLPLSLKCELANTAARAFYRHLGWQVTETGTGPDGPWERLWLPVGDV